MEQGSLETQGGVIRPAFPGSTGSGGEDNVQPDPFPGNVSREEARAGKSEVVCHSLRKGTTALWVLLTDHPVDFAQAPAFIQGAIVGEMLASVCPAGLIEGNQRLDRSSSHREGGGGSRELGKTASLPQRPQGREFARQGLPVEALARIFVLVADLQQK